jgi:TonB-dependent SusC/RagA subfamily outer membrane receptor
MICGLAVTTFTSCSKDDDDDSGKGSSLLGNWFVKINYIDDEEGEPIEGDYTEYILLNFGDGGVITRTIYSGNAGVPLMYWERDVQSGTYTVNETAKTVTVKGLSYEEETSKYNISGDKLTLTTTYEYDYEEDDFSTTFHRPTTEDQDLISLLDSKAKEGMDMDGFDSSMREMDLLSLRENPTRPWEEVDPTDMLKDAAGAAIYGARAANGVIIVAKGTK